jgi:uncharacterized protein (TIGR03437 family)
MSTKTRRILRSYSSSLRPWSRRTILPPLFGSAVCISLLSLLMASLPSGSVLARRGGEEKEIQAFGCSNATFLAGKRTPVGNSPQSGVVGDFNQDQKLDVIVTNYGDDTIKVFFGDGFGSFFPGPEYVTATGAGPGDIAAGDLNGDTRPDIVVANEVGESISVFLSLPNGMFGIPTNIPVGGMATSVALGDLNNDTRADVVVSKSQTDEVAVLLGTGTGAFGAPTSFTVGDEPISVAIALINNDANLDVAVANNESDNVSVLFGNGAGGLGSATNFTTGMGPFDVAARDINKDNRADLIVANDVDGTVSILMNNGSGSFGAKTDIPAGVNAGSVLTGDFNADTNIDVATANFGSNDISVLLGNGAGVFSPAVNYSAGFNPYTVIGGNFNADQAPDLIAINSSGNDITLLTSTGPGTFNGSINRVVGFSPNGLAVADFNGDQNLDIAVANEDPNEVGEVTYLPGTANGRFGAEKILPAGNGPVAIVSGDFTNDGKLDLAVANSRSSNVSILAGDGAGDFAAPLHLMAGQNPVGIAAADVNGDTRLDLLVISDFRLAVFRANATGGFDAPTSLDLPAVPAAIATGDLTGDNRPEAVITFEADVVLIILNNGMGVFSIGAGVSVGDAPKGVLLADFNADSRLDLVTANSGSNPITGSTISVALGNGTGGFAAAKTLKGGSEPLSVTSGDFNSDGRRDLVVGNRASRDVTVFFGDSAGSFSPPFSFATVADATALAVGDFNKDTKLDVAVSSSRADSVSILNNACAGAAGAITTVSAASFTPGVPVAAASIVAGFGNNLALVNTNAATIPLPIILSGTSVQVTDANGDERFAPLFGVFTSQINYQIPPGTVDGPAQVKAVNGNGTISLGDVMVARVNPGLFAANADGSGVPAAYTIRFKPGGQQIEEDVFQFNPQLLRYVPREIDLSIPGDRVFLILFGTGIRFYSSINNVVVRFGNQEQQVDAALAHGTYVGLDQVNVEMLRSKIPPGPVTFTLTVDGITSRPLDLLVK